MPTSTKPYTARTFTVPADPISPAEWLETDGLGGYASGTATGIRTRRYHALLLTATTPPTGRVALVNGFDAWLETPSGQFALSSQAYEQDVIHPDGWQHIVEFMPEPWPMWRYRCEDGTELDHELVVRHGLPLTVLTWRLRSPRTATNLYVRPFLSGRDYHGLHHENSVFNFEASNARSSSETVNVLTWHPYPGIPGITSITNGTYQHAPEWYRNFLYHEERARGLDHVEDLASPGVFRWELSRGEACLIFTVAGQKKGLRRTGVTVERLVQRLKREEMTRRAAFPSRLHRSAEAYIVNRMRTRLLTGNTIPRDDGRGKTIIAGYPWFTDWGRDTFISIRGLCLAGGRLDDARDILLAWADTVSEGMLPNRFPDHGQEPEYNSVDASLWYVIAVHGYLDAMAATKRRVASAIRKHMQGAVEAILTGYARGTRYGIHLAEDGLIAAGVPGMQLTWMDAKVGSWVVTPRIGKPVEIQALWLNSLACVSSWSDRWARLLKQGLESFQDRFWNAAGGYLYDVVDIDHQSGMTDALFRPNQIFAVGGLPLLLMDATRARRIIDAVEARLVTRLGLRTLAPGEPGYRPYGGGTPADRDASYHNGTVWPWLLGPFVEAWVRTRGGSLQAKHEARKKFLLPLLEHLDEAGLGHLPETADSDGARPSGCPFQAWSLGEALRLSLAVLKTSSSRR